MSDVFISYARKDRDFVSRLNDELVKVDREPWVDWTGIPPTAEWLQEIFAGIEAADNFGFVISPDSLASDVCRKEIDHAVANQKRIIPILHRPVADSQIPEALARINFIFFRESDDFQSAFSLLTEALDTDLTWKRTHTRLLLRARDWEANSKDSSFLLRGKELEEAEQWSAASTGDVNSAARIRQDSEGGETSLTSPTHSSHEFGIIDEFLDASIRHRAETSTATREAEQALQVVQRDAATLEQKRSRLDSRRILFAVASPISALFASSQIERLGGKSAPYGILIMMLMAIILGAVHLEAKSKFGSGSTFTVVRSSLGIGFAAFSIYGILFDSLLLGGILLTSAASYFQIAMDTTFRLISGAHINFADSGWKNFGTIFVIVTILFFWIKRIRRLHRSIPNSVRGAIWVLALLCVGWTMATIIEHPTHLPPFPSRYSVAIPVNALGWIRGTALDAYPWVLLLIPIAASVLVFSNEEAVLRYVNCSLPTSLGALRWNVLAASLGRFALPIIVPFACVMVVPDAIRMENADAPISGLMFHVIGAYLLRGAAALAVACVSTYVLLAVYDAVILRPDGVFAEAAGHGVMTKYFQDDLNQNKQRTRLIHLFALLQLAVVFAARGNIQCLVDAYGVGIGVSLSLKTIGLMVARYPQSPEGWRFPLNLSVRSYEIPIGLILVAIVLCLLTFISLLSRKPTSYCLLFASFLLLVWYVTRERVVLAQAPR